VVLAWSWLDISSFGERNGRFLPRRRKKELCRRYDLEIRLRTTRKSMAMTACKIAGLAVRMTNVKSSQQLTQILRAWCRCVELVWGVWSECLFWRVDGLKWRSVGKVESWRWGI